MTISHHLMAGKREGVAALKAPLKLFSGPRLADYHSLDVHLHAPFTREFMLPSTLALQAKQ